VRSKREERRASPDFARVRLSHVVIETERLLLRPLGLADIESSSRSTTTPTSRASSDGSSGARPMSGYASSSASGSNVATACSPSSIAPVIASLDERA
jgi:hypothetical protein